MEVEGFRRSKVSTSQLWADSGTDQDQPANFGDSKDLQEPKSQTQRIANTEAFAPEETETEIPSETSLGPEIGSGLKNRPEIDSDSHLTCCRCVKTVNPTGRRRLRHCPSNRIGGAIRHLAICLQVYELL